MDKAHYESHPTRILLLVTALRHEGESAIDAACRRLVNEALEKMEGDQRLAAMFLGISAREMNYRASKLKLRPCDRRQ